MNDARREAVRGTLAAFGVELSDQKVDDVIFSAHAAGARREAATDTRPLDARLEHELEQYRRTPNGVVGGEMLFEFCRDNLLPALRAAAHAADAPKVDGPHYYQSADQLIADLEPKDEFLTWCVGELRRYDDLSKQSLSRNDTRNYEIQRAKWNVFERAVGEYKGAKSWNAVHVPAHHFEFTDACALTLASSSKPGYKTLSIFEDETTLKIRLTPVAKSALARTIEDAPAHDDALADQLDELASDLEGSIEAHRKQFGDYIDGNRSTIIVEHQLNKRDLGEEPRLLRNAAAALRRRAHPERVSEKMVEAATVAWTTPGLSSHLPERMEAAIEAALKASAEDAG
jgi:hypothetical protein